MSTAIARSPSPAIATALTTVIGISLYAMSGPAHAAPDASGNFDACQPVRVGLENTPSPGKRLTAVAFPSGAEQLTTVERIVPSGAKELAVTFPLNGTTAIQAPQRAAIQMRNAYVSVATLNVPGQSLRPCAIAANAPELRTMVRVESFSTDDGEVHVHPAQVIGELLTPHLFSERGMTLSYVEGAPEIVSGSLVMAGDSLVGIVRDAADPTVAIVAADIAPSFGLPGINRVAFDSGSGTVSYEGLELRSSEQPKPGSLGAASGFVVAHVQAAARPAFEKLLGAAGNNALLIRSMNDRPVSGLPELLALLARCPAAPDPACLPTDAWGARLTESDAVPAVARALVAVQEFKYFVERLTPSESLRATTTEKLDRLLGMLVQLDQTPDSPDFRKQASAVTHFWRSEIDSFGGGVIFELAKTIKNADALAAGTAVANALQGVAGTRTTPQQAGTQGR